MCKTPVQKTNPNLKRKIKKKLLKTNKSVQKPIYLCGSCKKSLPEDLQMYTLLYQGNGFAKSAKIYKCELLVLFYVCWDDIH